MNRSIYNPHKQSGVVLVAALIILVVLTLLGIAAMDTTGIEMKMSNNMRDQQQAFESAEFILTAVENDVIQSAPFTDAELTNSGCSSVMRCFNTTCSAGLGGYCFNGSGPQLYSSCVLSPPATNPWDDPTLWSTAGKYQTMQIADATNPTKKITVKYIVEFRCYVPADPSTSNIAIAGNNAKLFRITAYATGSANKGRVMLQSTVKLL